MKKNKFTIALDFDGTCVSNRYPNVGDDAPKCVETLKKWIEKYDVGIILYTMRCDKQLDDAIAWFKKHDIDLYGVQKDPNQESWTSSPKCNALLCIDDRNVGCPLKTDADGFGLVVDWEKVSNLVEPVLEFYHRGE